MTGCSGWTCRGRGTEVATGQLQKEGNSTGNVGRRQGMEGDKGQLCRTIQGRGEGWGKAQRWRAIFGGTRWGKGSRCVRECAGGQLGRGRKGRRGGERYCREALGMVGDGGG